jgi:transposase
MFVKKLPVNKDGKTLLIFAESIRIPNGYTTNAKGNKVKTYKIRQKKIKTIGYYEDLLELYEDPIAHFKAEAKRINETNKQRKIENTISVEYNTDELFDINTNTNNLYNLGYVMINAIYHELEIDYLWNNRRRYTGDKFNHNMIFLLLVIDRIIYSSSKKGALSKTDYFFENFNFTLDDTYRALSFFAKYKVDLLKVLNQNVIKRYNRNTDLLFYDVTNFYFEIDEEDDLRKKGVSKEHKPNPIVQMGLFMDDKGMPISYHKYEGNKNDCLTFIPSLETIGFDLDFDNVIYVADKGMMSGTNLSRIIKEKSGYVISYSVRKADKAFQEWVLDETGYEEWVEEDNENNHAEKVIYKRKSRMQPRVIWVDKIYRDKNEKVKTKKVEFTINERQIVFYSSAYAKKAKKDREKTIEKAKKIASGKSASSILNKGAMSLINNLAVNKETGEIESNQWGLIKDFDEKKLEEIEKLDGYYAIMSNVIGIEENEIPFKAKHRWTKDNLYQLNKKVTDSDIIQMYKGLWKIEESFKVTKTGLKARPMYVRKEDHIEAHLLVCFTALLILRALEVRSNLNAFQIQKLIQEFQVDEISENLFKTTYFSPELYKLGKAVGLDLRKKQYTRKELKSFISESKKFGHLN